MRHLIPFILFTLLIGSSFSNAQQVDRCATMEMDSIRRAQDPQTESLEDFENWLEIKMHERQNALPHGRTGAVVTTIPVIVHVIHNGDGVGSGENISQAQVNSQIDVLNEDFRRMQGSPGWNNNPVGADSEIEFCMATIDPNGNVLAEPGIDRVNLGQSSWTSMNSIEGTAKPQTYWDPNAYFNIWVVRFGGGLGQLLGYAQFPNSSGLSGMNNNNGSADTDGVVIGYSYFGNTGAVSPPFNGGRTATHEVGHWLGLRHIWGDGNCNVDDYCTDTPNSDGANYGCPNASSCGSTDMVENYMDYSNDACMNIFTACQKTRMQTVLSNSPRRNTLGTSNVCSQAGQAPIAGFSASSTTGCPGHTVQFSDASSNGPTSWAWQFPGGTPTSSTSQNPLVSYANTGTYNVTLTVTNANGNDVTTVNNYITITTGANGIFFAEDFESGPNGWSVYNPDNGTTWGIVPVAGNTPGSNAAGIDIYNYNAPGQQDGLVSPVLDFAGQTNVTLDFEHAHRRYSQNESDSLVLYLSTDGGTTFTYRLYGAAENGSGNFATNTTTQNQFVPAIGDDWCFTGGVGASCITINLSQFDGMSNLRLLWMSVNDYGNNIYVDNIELSGTCSGQAAAPIANFNANEVSGCEPLSVTFTDQSVNQPTAWSWQFPGGTPATSTQQNPTVDYTSPGMYSVTLTASNATGSNTNTYSSYITVYSNPPAPTITQNGFVLTSSPGVSYQWYENNQLIQNATNQSYTVTQTGSYSVTITDTNDCSNSSGQFFVNVPVSLEDALLAKGLDIYPNPTHSLLNIGYAEGLSLKGLQLMDKLGRVVMTESLETNGDAGMKVLDLSGFAEGLYFLRVQGVNAATVKKVVVAR